MKKSNGFLWATTIEYLIRIFSFFDWLTGFFLFSYTIFIDFIDLLLLMRMNCLIDWLEFVKNDLYVCVCVYF